MGANQADALKTLNNMPDVNSASITMEKTRLPMMEQEIRWRFSNDQDNGAIYLHDDKVTVMQFYNEKNYLLLDLLKIYGQPDFIYLDKAILDGVYVEVTILYLSKGICLTYEPLLIPFYNPSNIRVWPISRIRSVYYTDPSIPDWQLNVSCLSGIKSSVYNAHVQKWNGYRAYSFQ